MKRTLTLALIVAFMSSGAAMAQPGSQNQQQHRDGPQDPKNCGHPGQPKCGPSQGPQNNQQNDRRGERQDQPRGFPGSAGGPRYSRGEKIPEQFRQDQFAVSDWQRNNLPKPAAGYRWMCYERGNCFLVATRTGVIQRSLSRGDRDQSWRKRYARTYTYNDDLYYRECRSRPDPAGILVGGLIGGILGRSLGDDRAGATFAGIIVGGAVGAALTRDLDCEDRSYAYSSYYKAFNGGRAGTVYKWRNPRNNHRGEFRVRSYYYDEDGFYCANYTHVVNLGRSRQATGRACRQPDGAWTFLN